ncbi:hypothetical protein ACWCYZ_42145 [Streptomyces virginiae]
MTVLHRDEPHAERTATDWTEVRAIVGEEVEAIITTLTDDQRQDAYGFDVPPLNRALTNPQTQQTVDTSGAWRTPLPNTGASVTVTALVAPSQDAQKGT